MKSPCSRAGWPRSPPTSGGDAREGHATGAQAGKLPLLAREGKTPTPINTHSIPAAATVERRSIPTPLQDHVGCDDRFPFGQDCGKSRYLVLLILPVPTKNTGWVGILDRFLLWTVAYLICEFLSNLENVVKGKRNFA